MALNKLSKMNDITKKNIMLSIVIFLFGLLVVGGTYAYLLSSINITNNVYNSSTTCFNISYSVNNDDNTSDITGTLFPSSGPSGGLMGKVTIGIDPSCNVNALGDIYLNVSTIGDLLLESVDAHCENSQTLKTMPSYTTSSTCTAQTNGVWVTAGYPLKYAIYNTSTYSTSTVPVKVGYISSKSDINIYEDFILYDVDSSTQKTAATNAGFNTSGNISYYIYIWMDGNITDNSYANLAFSANIHAQATQADCDLTNTTCYNQHAG